MAGGLTLQERRELWAAAREAYDGLGDELWRGGSAELEAVMGEIDGLVVAGEAARVVVTAEAMSRGETGSGALALTPVQWVRRHAPSLKSGGAASVVAVAEAFAVAGNAPIKDAVLSGVLPSRSAAVVVSEADKLRPLLVDEAEPAVLEGLIEMAVREGPRGCRQLRPALLARYGLDGQLQAEQDAMKRFVALSQPRVDECGLAEYRLTLDVEGRAVLEAALGPLSAPQPVDGERDLRPSDQRRGEALVALVKRAVASADATPKNSKSQLFVTVDLETLRNGLRGAGETLAGTESGTLLAPETVRRLACDATIIPTVMGVAGEVVDLGRGVRLFTRGADQAALVPRPMLHLSRVRYARAVGRCASPDSLGRRRRERPRQRRPALRTAPHDRAHSGDTRGGSCRTRWAPGSSGTCGPVPTTSCSPGSLPRNPRDPAPHPARGRGRNRASLVCVERL